MTALRIISAIIGIAIMVIGIWQEMKTIRIIREDPKHDSGEACLCIILIAIIFLIGATIACYGPEMVIGIDKFLSL